MGKFIYNMESILRIKIKIEEQKKLELGESMQIYNLEIEEQIRCEKELSTSMYLFKEAQKGPIQGEKLKKYSNSISYYKKYLEKQIKKVEMAKYTVEVKRKAVQKALEEKKIQEKLKEHAYESFLKEENLKEQNLLDEVVSYGYATKKNSNILN